MQNKISLFVTEPVNNPNTFMEQFCQTLHPDLELGTICVSWFRQATKHCTEVINNVQVPSYFWTTVKNFIFTERHTDIISTKIPISIHPQHLTIQDCQSLFVDIVKDYIERAPRYAAESATNAMLWHVLYSLMGIISLGSLLLGTIFFSNKYDKPKQRKELVKEGHMQEKDQLLEIYKPENRLLAAAKRSLLLAKTEVRQIHMKPVVKPEELLAPDGTHVLVLKVSTKVELMESLIKSTIKTSGKLHRPHHPYQTDFPNETLAKAMKFLDNDCKKLRLLLMFDEDIVFEEDTVKKCLQSKVPPLQSPIRSSDFTNKSGPPLAVPASKGSSFGFGFSSPRSGSPRQATTPRSGSSANTGIPRKTFKSSPQKAVTSTKLKLT